MLALAAGTALAGASLTFAFLGASHCRPWQADGDAILIGDNTHNAPGVLLYTRGPLACDANPGPSKSWPALNLALLARLAAASWQRGPAGPDWYCAFIVFFPLAYVFVMAAFLCSSWCRSWLQPLSAGRRLLREEAEGRVLAGMHAAFM